VTPTSYGVCDHTSLLIELDKTSTAVSAVKETEMSLEGRNELPIVPIGVRNAPFTLDLMARDCPPLQFLREFSAMASRRLTPSGFGSIPRIAVR
jgi:hypothetical protein